MTADTDTSTGAEHAEIPPLRDFVPVPASAPPALPPAPPEPPTLCGYHYGELSHIGIEPITDGYDEELFDTLTGSMKITPRIRTAPTHVRVTLTHITGMTTTEVIPVSEVIAFQNGIRALEAAFPPATPLHVRLRTGRRIR